MRCSKAEMLMMRYIDAPLSMGRLATRRFFGHISRCGGCREEFAVYEEMIHSFAEGTPEEEPRAGFEARVAAAVAERKRKRLTLGQIGTVAWCVLSVLAGVAVFFLLSADPVRGAQFMGMIGAAYEGALAVVTRFLDTYRWILMAATAAAAVVWSRMMARARIRRERVAEQVRWN